MVRLNLCKGGIKKGCEWYSMRVIQSVKGGVKTLYIKRGVLKWYSMSVIQCEGCEGCKCYSDTV